MEAIVNLFQSIYPLSDQFVKALAERLHTKEVKKKQLLLKEGQIAQEIYFIHKGYFKSFYKKDALEITQWFMKPGDIIIAVNSFYKRVPSYEYIQCINDAEISYISHDDLDYLYNHFIEFNFIGRVLTEKYYILSEERLLGLRKLKAEERYHLFQKNNNDLLNHVSLTDIASYLGISLETLSRIRGKK
ncbi:Crp/Fnr family transcriptional regulator [Ferruginibacter yonginensis]|uniref:Crp/Fnr family transcriptional regulator n=1 Tax=Ferruginibacter yonginensis TaxID=1310416 RepID=A0ABV8QSM3_9BACT